MPPLRGSGLVLRGSGLRLLTSPRGPTSSLQGERAGGGRRSPWLPLPPALPFPLSVGLGPAWHAWQAVPSRAGPARKTAQQAVPGPLVRHDARLGTAQEARVPCRPDILRAVPGTGPCRAELGRPDGQVYMQPVFFFSFSHFGYPSNLIFFKMFYI